MADRFEDLKTFVTVVDCGGINAAAARLGIAKSAVSRRLSELEARLQVQLIERSTRSFQVTSIGQDYYVKANRLISSWDEMDADASGLISEDVLVVTAPAALLAHLIVPAATRFRERCDLPSFRFQVLDGADVGVRLFIGSAAEKGAVHLVDSPRVVCAAPAYLETAGVPLRLLDLQGRSGIAVESAGPADWTFARGARHRPDIVVTTPDEESALTAAIGGAGLVQLDAFMVAPALKRAELVAVLEEHAPTPRVVSAALADGASASARRFVDKLVRELAAGR